jgi:hypothetical protein
VAYFGGEKTLKKWSFGVAYLPKKHGNTPHSEGIIPWEKHGNMHYPLIREKTTEIWHFSGNFFGCHLVGAQTLRSIPPLKSLSCGTLLLLRSICYFQVYLNTLQHSWTALISMGELIASLILSSCGKSSSLSFCSSFKIDFAEYTSHNALRSSFIKNPTNALVVSTR